MTLSDNAKDVWIALIAVFGALIIVSMIITIATIDELNNQPITLIMKTEMDNNTLNAITLINENNTRPCQPCQPTNCNSNWTPYYLPKNEKIIWVNT